MNLSIEETDPFEADLRGLPVPEVVFNIMLPLSSCSIRSNQLNFLHRHHQQRSHETTPFQSDVVLQPNPLLHWTLIENYSGRTKLPADTLICHLDDTWGQFELHRDCVCQYHLSISLPHSLCPSGHSATVRVKDRGTNNVFIGNIQLEDFGSLICYYNAQHCESLLLQVNLVCCHFSFVSAQFLDFCCSCKVPVSIRGVVRRRQPLPLDSWTRSRALLYLFLSPPSSRSVTH